jgi:hypothetical protein
LNLLQVGQIVAVAVGLVIGSLVVFGLIVGQLVFAIG